MKVRFIEETADDLTKGKNYKVISESEKGYVIKDDEGDKISALKHHFEIVASKQLKETQVAKKCQTV